MQLSACWRAGRWAPGWAAGANYGFGDARFCLYPPFSFVLGALLCTALPLRVVPAVFVWLALFLGGCSMYAASGQFADHRRRLRVAVLYALSPYLITTALVRFAAAELLTLAWLPLVGLFFYRVLWHFGRRETLTLAGLLALTWLTNIPASVVLLYCMGAAAMVASVLARSPLPFGRFILAEAISGTLAAWYLLPVLGERKWINSDAAWRLNSYQANFLFTPASQLLLPSFSYLCWSIACLSTAAILLLAWSQWRVLRFCEPAVTWISLGVFAFLFQLPFTAVLWAHLPELRYADFPYRFLSLTSLALPLLLFSRGMPEAARRPAYLMLALLATLPFLQFAYTYRTLSRLPSFDALTSAWSKDGYWGSPELVPDQAGKPLHSLHLPQIALAAGEPPEVCTLTEQASEGGTSLVVNATCKRPAKVRLAVYYYPFWHGVDERGLKMELGRDNYGLLVTTLPQGTHTLRLDFRSRSRLRTASQVLSLLSLGGWIVLYSGKSRKRKIANLNHPDLMRSASASGKLPGGDS